MAWNKPGDGGDDKDKDRNTDQQWQRNQDDGPPDLDVVLGRLSKRLKSVLGGSGRGGDTPDSGMGASMSFFFIVIALLWALSGIFIVGPGEQAVILQFGKYVKALGAGPHWVPRFVNSYHIVNVEQVSTYTYESQMLNKDENIVSVALAVHYRIRDPQLYLFNVKNPTEGLRQATASALRQVVGHMTLDQVLTSGRNELREDVEQQLNSILAMYKTGIEITDVALQSTKAPEAVKKAFDDAITAQEDEQRFIHEAKAYARGKLPRAEGHAKRIIYNAEAYKQETIAASKGESERFLSVLKEYKRAPIVTRNRIYLDSMRNVLVNSNKVLVDAKGSNMMYLPLDQITRGKLDKDLSGKLQLQAEEVQRKVYEDALQMSRNSYAQQPVKAASGRSDRSSYQGRRFYE